MRLAEDRSSWKASGIERRDFRHAHDGPETPSHVRKKKSTKLWCKGRKGVPHAAPVRVKGQWGMEHDECPVCHKHLAYFWRRPS